MDFPRSEARRGIARKGRLTSATLQKAHAGVFEDERATPPEREEIEEQKRSRRDVNWQPDGDIGALVRVLESFWETGAAEQLGWIE